MRSLPVVLLKVGIGGAVLLSGFLLYTEVYLRPDPLGNCTMPLPPRADLPTSDSSRSDPPELERAEPLPTAQVRTAPVTTLEEGIAAARALPENTLTEVTAKRDALQAAAKTASRTQESVPSGVNEEIARLETVIRDKKIADFLDNQAKRNAARR